EPRSSSTTSFPSASGRSGARGRTATSSPRGSGWSPRWRRSTSPSPRGWGRGARTSGSSPSPSSSSSEGGGVSRGRDDVAGGTGHGRVPPRTRGRGGHAPRAADAAPRDQPARRPEPGGRAHRPAERRAHARGASSHGDPADPDFLGAARESARGDPRPSPPAPPPALARHGGRMNATLPPPPYAVIGLGRIGTALTRALSRTFPENSVLAVEPDPRLRARALLDRLVMDAQEAPTRARASTFPDNSYLEMEPDARLRATPLLVRLVMDAQEEPTPALAKGGQIFLCGPQGQLESIREGLAPHLGEKTIRTVTLIVKG